MKAAKAIVVILAVFLASPIWYYLLYKILVAVNASELMMFLFWIYVPVGILVGILKGIIDANKP